MPEQIKPNPKLKYDLRNQNFDEYCHLYFSKITKDQKKMLPYEIAKKLHLPHRLTFLQKAYVLSVVFNIEGYFLIPSLSGNEPCLTAEEFLSIKDRKETIEDAEWILDNIGFVLSTKDIVSAVVTTANLSVSPAAKYIIKSRNKKLKSQSDLEKFNFNTQIVGTLIMNYACTIKQILSDNDITMAEWYALLYMRDGKEKHIYPVYELMKHAFGASHKYISEAFPKLAHKGYLERFGGDFRKKVTYKLTVRGLAFYNEIISGYITNF